MSQMQYIQIIFITVNVQHCKYQFKKQSDHNEAKRQ